MTNMDSSCLVVAVMRRSFVRGSWPALRMSTYAATSACDASSVRTGWMRLRA